MVWEIIIISVLIDDIKLYPFFKVVGKELSLLCLSIFSIIKTFIVAFLSYIIYNLMPEVGRSLTHPIQYLPSSLVLLRDRRQ